MVPALYYCGIEQDGTFGGGGGCWLLERTPGGALVMTPAAALSSSSDGSLTAGSFFGAFCLHLRWTGVSATLRYSTHAVWRIVAGARRAPSLGDFTTAILYPILPAYRRYFTLLPRCLASHCYLRTTLPASPSVLTCIPLPIFSLPHLSCSYSPLPPIDGDGFYRDFHTYSVCLSRWRGASA